MAQGERCPALIFRTNRQIPRGKPSTVGKLGLAFSPPFQGLRQAQLTASSGQQEAMAGIVGITVNSDDVAAAINRVGSGVDSSGKIDRSEIAVAQ